MAIPHIILFADANCGGNHTHVCESMLFIGEFNDVTAYMNAVGIKRWKFNQLIECNKIRTIKKKRKIYVPTGEVERFFLDPSVQ